MGKALYFKVDNISLDDEKRLLDLLFNKDDFHFGSGINENNIKNYFESKDFLLSNYRKTFQPKIIKRYYDLYTGLPTFVQVTMYDIQDNSIFCLFEIKNQITPILQFVSKKEIDITLEKHNAMLVPKEINDEISSVVFKKGINAVECLENYKTFKNHSLIVEVTLLNTTFLDVLKLIIVKETKTSFDDVKLTSIRMDMSDLTCSRICEVYYKNKDTDYIYNFTNKIFKKCKPCIGEAPPSYFLFGLRKCIDLFLEENKELIDEVKYYAKKERISSYILNKYKEYLPEVVDSKIRFNSLDDEVITFTSSDILVNSNRSIKGQVSRIFYSDIKNNYKKLDSLIENYLKTDPEELKKYKELSENFLKEKYNIESIKKDLEELISFYDKLCEYDKSKHEYKTTNDKITNMLNTFLQIDFDIVDSLKKQIKSINNIENLIELGENLYDTFEQIEESKKELLLKDIEIDEFLQRFNDVLISKDIQNTKSYRRVFISKNCLSKLKEFDEAHRDLKLMKTVDEIVYKLKTTPGDELGKYLLLKGLNLPINNDRSIKKIRIKNNEKYRLLFVYGDEIDSNIINKDSIYIFQITEHKDVELKNLEKPTQFELYKFIIYPIKNKTITIPECTKEQYEIANLEYNSPSITYGCAGSGKTTVSIEKYVNIIYNEYNSISQPTDKIAYITFHKGLADRVKKDLQEYEISANCFKLSDYFAWSLKKDITKETLITESLFIKWFDSLEKNKDKISQKLAPLKNRPDLSRLIYTYYRGIYKGSIINLDNKKDKKLSLSNFLNAMGAEEYLTTKEKESIYEIAELFNKYCNNQNLISENDLALEIINTPDFKLNRTETIIIDEVQDLTETEIAAVLKTLKQNSNRIYYFGDPHQSIHPNVFNHSTITNVHHKLKRDDRDSIIEKQLYITYRTNSHLIDYLNKLLKKREKWIGLIKGGVNNIEMPQINESTSWGAYVTNNTLYEKLFIANPNSIIITPSDNIKEDLIKRYPSISKERVLTIYESKGMEWETVIMYNMFTDYHEYFLDMVNENGHAKKSTIHRMTFNKYYVACTRSTKSFVIVEEDLSVFEKEDNKIYDEFLSSLAKISQQEQVSTYISEDNTFEGWYKEALQNIDNEDEQTYLHALAHAKSLARTKEQRELVNRIDIKNISISTIQPLAYYHLKRKEYKLAGPLYNKCAKENKAFKAYSQLCYVNVYKNDFKEKHFKDFLKNIRDLYADETIKEEMDETFTIILNHPTFKKLLRDSVYNQIMSKEKRVMDRDLTNEEIKELIEVTTRLPNILSDIRHTNKEQDALIADLQKEINELKENYKELVKKHNEEIKEIKSSVSKIRTNQNKETTISTQSNQNVNQSKKSKIDEMKEKHISTFIKNPKATLTLIDIKKELKCDDSYAKEISQELVKKGYYTQGNNMLIKANKRK